MKNRIIVVSLHLALLLFLAILATGCSSKTIVKTIVPIEGNDPLLNPCLPSDFKNEATYRELELYTIDLINVIEICNLDKLAIKKIIERSNNVK